jgi:hypothetical protein
MKKLLLNLKILMILTLVISVAGCGRASQTADTDTSVDDGATSSVEVIDAIAPITPMSFRVDNKDDQLTFSWAANNETDLAGYILYYGKANTGKFSNGVDVGLTTDYIMYSLENGATYSFALCAYDTANNSSPWSTILTATPTDKSGPDDPTDFILKKVINDPITSMNYFELSWKKPNDRDFQGVMVIRKENGFISGPNDGTVIYQGTDENCTDKTAETGVMYYYKIFSYDDVPNFSPGDPDKTEKSGTLVPITVDQE